jgi:hypothetical protein
MQSILLGFQKSQIYSWSANPFRIIKTEPFIEKRPFSIRLTGTGRISARL